MSKPLDKNAMNKTDATHRADGPDGADNTVGEEGVHQPCKGLAPEMPLKIDNLPEANRNTAP